MPFGSQFYSWIAQAPILFFIFWFGACAGSFINVLVYRLPKGLGVVVPPSRCPSCEHKLSWKENIPILGWVLLRGRCRFCKAKISVEYPLVETFVAVLFAGLYMLWFMEPSPFVFVGVDADFWRPEWAYPPWQFKFVWPYFVAVLLLLGGLTAATIIDARTFTIPIVIPWVVAGVGVAGHITAALLVPFSTYGQLLLNEHRWVIPVEGWAWTAAALGGGVGLVVSNVLLRVGVMPLSFGDYEEWERETLAARENKTENGGEGGIKKPSPQPSPFGERERGPEGEEEGEGRKEGQGDTEGENGEGRGHHEIGSIILRVLLLTGPAIVGMWMGVALGDKFGNWQLGLGLGAGVGLVVGIVLRRVVGSPAPTEDDPIWLHYPFIRRELGKELLFVLPIAAGFGLGWVVGSQIVSPTAPLPLWVAALGGSLLGMLVGGGIVWAVRLVFSYAFDMEAMGLGDVHLMAGVGAVLGWIDPLLAFFVAPLFGLLWAVMTPVLRRVVKRLPTALPYGPHLAMATVVMVVGKPVVEGLLGMMVGGAVDLP